MASTPTKGSSSSLPRTVRIFSTQRSCVQVVSTVRSPLAVPDVRGREEILGFTPATNRSLRKLIFLSSPSRPLVSPGADLANLVNEAALLAARENRTKISQEDLEKSIERVVAGPKRKTAPRSATPSSTLSATTKVGMLSSVISSKAVIRSTRFRSFHAARLAATP